MPKSQIREEGDLRMTGDRFVIARLRHLGISKGRRSRGNLLLGTWYEFFRLSSLWWGGLLSALDRRNLLFGT